MKLGARVDLKRYGGYDMDFVLTSIGAMNVRTLTIDRTKTVTRTTSGAVAVVVADYRGTYTAAAASSYTDTVPTTTPYEIPLTHGIAVEGYTVQKLFLLYQDDKIAIYYQDTLATAAGMYRLKIKTRPAN